YCFVYFVFFFQAEDGIRDDLVTGVQTCALPICCRGRVRFAVLLSAPLNGATSKLFPSVVETATGLAGSTLSNSSTGLSRISANEFPCRTSILIISGDSLYVHCITIQAPIFYQNIVRGETPTDSIYDTPHMTLVFLTFNVGVLAAQV